MDTIEETSAPETRAEQTEAPLEPEDHVVPQRGAAILLALLRKHHVPQHDPVNRAQRRARGGRGHNYGLGSMAVPKTRKVKN